MSQPLQEKLEQLGLSPTEAAIYLILLRNRQAMGASAIAARAEMARSSIYPALTRLIDLGLVESEPAYGSGFTAVPPDQGLDSLIARETEELSARERLAKSLRGELESLAGSISEIPDPKLVQVLRDPRAVLERFERLQLETERQIVGFIKPPFFNRGGNPAQQKAQRRGVHYRGLYEKTALDEAGIRPYFDKWLATGEEARIYDGDLPHKLAIFDSKIALMPLILPGQQMKAVLIRHAQLVQTLSLGFEYLWDRSEQVASPSKVSEEKEQLTNRTSDRISRNGRRAQPAKKQTVKM
jgi:sugar-specific transcriptional regulator TrmB